MDATQLKISNAGRRMAVILRIAGIITSIAAAGLSIALCILLFSGESMKQSFLLAFDGATAGSNMAIPITPQSLLPLLSLALIDAVLRTMIIIFVHAIFSDIGKCLTPFSPPNTVRIKKVAILTIVVSIVGSFSDALMDYYTIGELTWSINGMGLMLGLILCCIALIFQYGCELQQQSDETL